VARLGTVVAAALLPLLASCSSAPVGSSGGDRPSLAVLLVIDQLTEDLFRRYDDLFTRGLRRLLDDGQRFENATHDHANTFTAPGHVTLSTGVHPARHGVVGNEWFVQEGGEWREVYSLEDFDSPVLGFPELSGRGPANIERTGLPDWIRANDPDSRVVSVSGKDRAAIGLAANAAGDVYWLERYGGEFVTSEHYRSALPGWVEDFNENDLPTLYSDTLWESIVPPADRSRSRPDSSRFEFDREHTAFPHRPSDRVDPADERAMNGWRWRGTPYPDRAVLAFAIRALRERELGRRGHVDYLGISLSQVDQIGHRYGPGSREQLDNLLRLDQELGRFFDVLDDQVGRGRWVLAMSADHGVLEIPEELAARGVDARRLTRSERADLRAALDGAGFTSGEDQNAAKQALLDLPFVTTAYTFDEIESGQPADSFAVLIANSHSRSRIVHVESRSGVYARLRENVLRTSTQATHGSPYLYDRHVPLVFLGGRVPAGTSTGRAATVDAAPTLARLTGVPTPDDLDGRVLDAVVR
jgi:predicted AlkP superfamily pyrophosphatase or phosphodiesterase